MKTFRKNPRDEKLLKTIWIAERKITNDVYNYTIYSGENEIGYANYNHGIITDIRLYNDFYKRKGIASIAINYIENKRKQKVKPFDISSEEGNFFWADRLNGNSMKKISKRNPKHNYMEAQKRLFENLNMVTMNFMKQYGYKLDPDIKSEYEQALFRLVAVVMFNFPKD